MPEPVGPVYWGSYPGELLERVMSVLLFQERGTAWRRRPSQGDGGLDVGEPNARGYHVYQIKGFTGSMDSSRRRQVRNSFERILDDPRLDRPVTGWSLVVPIAGEVEEACQRAAAALTVGRDRRSPRVIHRVRDFRGQLDPRRHGQCVRQLDEQLLNVVLNP